MKRFDKTGTLRPTLAVYALTKCRLSFKEICIFFQSRFVLMGEPSVDYDGLAQIILKRSMGNFGEVHVTWQIVRRDLDAFVQHQGDVSFADKQESAVITVQVE